MRFACPPKTSMRSACPTTSQRLMLLRFYRRGWVCGEILGGGFFVPPWGVGGREPNSPPPQKNPPPPRGGRIWRRQPEPNAAAPSNTTAIASGPEDFGQRNGRKIAATLKPARA